MATSHHQPVINWADSQNPMEGFPIPCFESSQCLDHPDLSRYPRPHVVAHRAATAPNSAVPCGSSWPELVREFPRSFPYKETEVSEALANVQWHRKWIPLQIGKNPGKTWHYESLSSKLWGLISLAQDVPNRYIFITTVSVSCNFP